MTRAVDTYVRDHLPAAKDLPVFDCSDQRFQSYPERGNCSTRFLDDRIAAGDAERIAFRDDAGKPFTFADMLALTERVAHVLANDLEVPIGGRVLLRSGNSPLMVALYLGAIRAGCIPVGTMPLLRGPELAQIADRGRIALAICDEVLASEIEEAKKRSDELRRVVLFQNGRGGKDDGELDRLLAAAPTGFAPTDTSLDDPCLLAFTSGTTGKPKGCVHTHRDFLAICDGYARSVLRATKHDVFVGSPPLAFTFGLGGLALFPMDAGATSVLVEQPAPPRLAEAIERFGATVCVTSPTGYRALVGFAKEGKHDLSTLRTGISAGEHLPAATFEAVEETLGIKLMDGIGSTEMLHIFIGSPLDRVRAGFVGEVVPGYTARIVDENGSPLGDGEPGRLAIRGPTGCRYLDDERQGQYVQDGWNITGDVFVRDADGYFRYVSRNDDLIVSAGYNIAGPEVENALLCHETVAECAVVGAPHPERGQIVKAFVVLRDGVEASADHVKVLQDHVKATIAPYKYPRAIEFCAHLPKTETGKLQRFKLRHAEEKAAAGGGAGGPASATAPGAEGAPS
jgi:2-aminobenzoate-CoA ligase